MNYDYYDRNSDSDGSQRFEHQQPSKYQSFSVQLGPASQPLSYLQPLGQQRLELAHVFEGKIESFKSGDCSLREVIAVEFSHGQPHISLGVTWGV